MTKAVNHLANNIKSLNGIFDTKITQNIQAFIIVAVIIFICALIGIWGRPLFFLAIFWPANAVLLGLFLRFDTLKNIGGWLGAFVGFMLADLLTGNFFLLTLLLTISNLLHPICTLILIRIFKLNYKKYNHGFTFVYLFILSAFGGCLASPIFAMLTIPHVPNTFISLDRIWTDFGMWWTGEILNIITFLSVILAIPNLKSCKACIQKLKLASFDYKVFFPFLAVIASVVLSHFFMGPGAIMFPIAALIWAALTYNLFVIALINCIISMLLYNSLTTYYIYESADAYLATTISVRIGLMMLALGPLTLVIISSNRQKLYRQILYLANHDSLTNTMNRRYFYEKSEKIITLSCPLQKANTVTILLLDLDYFKKINDQHGHAIGDIALQEFANLLKQQMSANDLLARLGGEEFAILFTDLTLQQSISIAEKIRNSIDQTPILLSDGNILNITVSMGLCYEDLPYLKSFQQLINRADTALYKAKNNGRNQLCLESNLDLS